MAISSGGTAIRITKADLDDPTLDRLNRELNFILSLVVRLEDRATSEAAAVASQISNITRITNITEGSDGSTFTRHFEYVTLSAATTELTSPVASPAEGDELYYKIMQDATGGRQITWQAALFRSDTPVDIDTTAETVTLMKFVALNDGMWWMVSYQTGVLL